MNGLHVQAEGSHKNSQSPTVSFYCNVFTSFQWRSNIIRKPDVTISTLVIHTCHSGGPKGLLSMRNKLSSKDRW